MSKDRFIFPEGKSMRKRNLKGMLIEAGRKIQRNCSVPLFSSPPLPPVPRTPRTKFFPQGRKMGDLFHPFFSFLFLNCVVAIVKSLWFFIFNFYGICSFIETMDKIWPSVGSCLLFLGWNLLELLAKHIPFMGLQTAWSSLEASTTIYFC